jgi:hypothetical protein
MNAFSTSNTAVIFNRMVMSEHPYSFCISNAASLLQSAMLCEDEHAALQWYADYVWFMEFARRWMKGGINA